MAWSTPPTFSVGEIPTAAKFNQIRDDLRHLKGLDGAIALNDTIVLPNTKALQFGTTSLFQTLTGAQTSLHVGDSAGACKAALYLPPSSRSYSPGIAILPAGTVFFMAGAFCLVYNNSTGAGLTRQASGQPGAAATNIDPVGTELSWRCDAGGSVTVTRTSGTATWTVMMLLFYY